MPIQHQITSNGLKLAVYEYGNPKGRSILFIHGLSQAAQAWVKQYSNQALAHCRILVMDIRGHGNSDKPIGRKYYNDSQFWADDVQSTINQLKLKNLVLVAWSYAGLIINDYLRYYGDEQIAAINFVSGAGKLEPTFDMFGEGLLDNAPAMMNADIKIQKQGLIAFLRACYIKQPLATEFEKILAYNQLVPPQVRAAMTKRTCIYENSMPKISVPTLISVGLLDNIVLPKMADYIKQYIPHASISHYQQIGHCPFTEDTKRFNKELAELVATSTKNNE